MLAGNSKRGTAWQLDSPELDTRNLSLKKPIIDDGEYGKISLGKHNSIFIGGIAHELGHALGLPHCRERSDEKEDHGTALMGERQPNLFDEVRDEGKGHLSAPWCTHFASLSHRSFPFGERIESAGTRPSF